MFSDLYEIWKRKKTRGGRNACFFVFSHPFRYLVFRCISVKACQKHRTNKPVGQHSCFRGGLESSLPHHFWEPRIPP